MISTFTIRLSKHASEALLPDLKALVPAESIQFFSNELDEEWHHTLLCQNGDQNCSLTVSAIVLWRLMGRITVINFTSPALTQDASTATTLELFALLKYAGAVLYIS
ncbi:hypothetical protein [[Pantoea] beijingensis]|uniref:hypothetical protein n=1 Tax=[Pantoea] beijingensis TaxID=1324864 RepID=UPI001E64DD57|nr:MULTISPECIES: hypothetical protein [Erwiniaceae]